jgi:hypothetical protein
VLPAVEIPWFDAQGKRQLARADGVTVTVGAAAASAGTIRAGAAATVLAQTSRTRVDAHRHWWHVASLALLAIAWAMRHAIASAVRWLDALAAGSWAGCGGIARHTCRHSTGHGAAPLGFRLVK